MNRTIAIHAMIQRALSPARMFLVLSVVGFPALVLSFAPQAGLSMLQSGGVLAMILGPGLIGQEVSAGVLQILFARPVSRSEYVLSRWMALSLCAVAAVVIEVGLGTLAMTMRGAAPPLDGIATLVLEQSLAAFGLMGVLTLLSSFLPGIGDIMAWIALNVAGGVLQMVSAVTHQPWVSRASEEWLKFLSPTLRLHDAFGNGVVSWFHLVSYFSTVALCLALAIVILNRRELSYATD